MKTYKKSVLAEYQKRCKSGNEECARCGSTTNITVDHIIPVFVLEQFLAEDERHNLEENFEFLCLYCNRMKSSRIDVRNPKTYTILEYLIKKGRAENSEFFHESDEGKLSKDDVYPAVDKA